jgi:zinc transporter ZupT
MAGAAAGVSLTNLPNVARRIVPISGAVLLLLSLIGVLPELVELYGSPTGPLAMLAGISVVWFIDRFVHPVCPTCSHTHDHDHCLTRLHGFATPLIVAAILHSLFDGWALVADHAGGALTAGILIHKLPESIACGVILRAAVPSRRLAMGWALGVQAATAAGGFSALSASRYVGSAWTGLLLALGGGTFVYLGFHAVHGEWKRRTAERAVRIG